MIPFALPGLFGAILYIDTDNHKLQIGRLYKWYFANNRVAEERHFGKINRHDMCKTVIPLMYTLEHSGTCSLLQAALRTLESGDMSSQKRPRTTASTGEAPQKSPVEELTTTPPEA